MLSCKEATRLVSQGLDQQLRWWNRLQLRIHLLLCALCSRTARQFQRLRDWIRCYAGQCQHQPATPSASQFQLSQPARNRIKERLRAETGDAAS
ncbi:hypothetical protein HRbin36_02724 [bacterium HR36]|nr:hypothetical protein HRbin36_02724 [bacterium HR36]